MTRSKTIIVIPCYNEARRLQSERVRRFVAYHHDIELLFVNDGSTDDTLNALHEMQQSVPGRLLIHDLPQNVGKGEAVRQGLLAACQHQADFIGFWDADLATPLDAIPQFRTVLQKQSHLHVVVGSRISLMGRQVHRKFRRHLIGRAFATVVSTMLGFAVYDTQCGAKLFRNHAELSKLFEDPFRSRWIFDVEIFARLHREAQCGKIPPVEQIVYELPLDQWEDVAGSKLKPSDFVQAAFDLLKINRLYALRSYKPAGVIPFKVAHPDYPEQTPQRDFIPFPVEQSKRKAA